MPSSIPVYIGTFTRKKWVNYESICICEAELHACKFVAFNAKLYSNLLNVSGTQIRSYDT